MKNEAIVLKNISKEYPGVIALSDVSFSVERGSIHGLVGPNGAGKSTIMKILAGLIPPTTGEFYVENSSDHAVGILPEESPLYMMMKVRDYLLFVGEINALSKKENRSSCDEIIKICHLEDVEHRLISNLSKGYKQRVGIAQALYCHPAIVILDEPFVGLDPNSVSEIRSMISRLKEKHTVLLSTHQLNEVENLCSEITIINNGQIFKSGNLDEIKKHFTHHQIIWIDLQGEKPLWVEKISDHYQGTTVSMEKNGRLKCLFSESEDMRGSLSRFIISEGGELLFIDREEIRLEEIFKGVN